jgi:hypothetical protein
VKIDLNFLYVLIGSDLAKNLTQMGIFAAMLWGMRRLCLLIKELRSFVGEARRAVVIMRRLTEELAYANGRTVMGEPLYEELNKVDGDSYVTTRHKGEYKR